MGYFKGKQFKKDIISVAGGYYCRFSLSYRDVLNAAYLFIRQLSCVGCMNMEM